MSDIRRRVPPIDRLLAKVEVLPNGCWRFTGHLLKGHGMIQMPGSSKERRPAYAHRVTYEYFIGPIPDGMPLDHVCHSNDLSCPGGDDCAHRACVNPTHLEPVSDRENARRGRAPSMLLHLAKRCMRGHPVVEGNRYKRGDSYVCKLCWDERSRKYYRRRTSA